jgi:2-isopropylmalate synthase
VYTAFSGSHQDAIKKGFEAMDRSGQTIWEVPYLPIDPRDVGRTYEDVIRVNSQSGKGGVAYLLKTEQELEIPRRLQIEFTRVIQGITDTTGQEITAAEIWTEFRRHYLAILKPFELLGFEIARDAEAENRSVITATVRFNDEENVIRSEGGGSIEAFVNALKKDLGVSCWVLDYHEHSIGAGTDAQAVCYVELEIGERTLWGVGINTDTTTASLQAIISGINRAS